VHCKVDLRIRMPALRDGQSAGYRAFSAEVFGDGAGEPMAVLRDAQETAELRSALAEAVEQAGATEVAKGRFLAAVSHELRTPLNAIIGFSEMLLHEEISGELSTKQAEHVTLIREAGNHLLSVVNAILDVSKIESGAYQITAEPFGLQQAADLCCAMLKPQADAKGITLAARVPFGLADVMGDQRAVQQILLNLLSNAIKFTPEGGSVTISAARKGEAVEIFVSDTGIGIAAEDLDKLGKPFMQVQNDYTRQFQGTGLGLSLVKGLVGLHDGTMSIESAPGLGTCVAIALPAAVGRTDEGKAAVAELVAAPDGTGEGNGVTLRKIA
jgi:cell cycle sensor histidine kinase DivJ